MIRVETKSKKESTKDATRETEEEESTARPFPSRRAMLTAKLTKKVAYAISRENKKAIHWETNH